MKASQLFDVLCLPKLIEVDWLMCTDPRHCHISIHSWTLRRHHECISNPQRVLLTHAKQLELTVRRCAVSLSLRLPDCPSLCLSVCFAVVPILFSFLLLLLSAYVRFKVRTCRKGYATGAGATCQRGKGAGRAVTGFGGGRGCASAFVKSVLGSCPQMTGTKATNSFKRNFLLFFSPSSCLSCFLCCCCSRVCCFCIFFPLYFVSFLCLCANWRRTLVAVAVLSGESG